MLNKQFFQKGQVALVIILLMVAVGTIALSLASRSLVDVTITQQQTSKIRSLSAAEAGIENLLSQELSEFVGVGQVGKVGDITYNYDVQTANQGDSYELESPLKIGETVEINLQSASSGNKPTSYTFCWTKQDNEIETDGNYASLEISYILYDGNSYSVKRFAYNPLSNAADSGFESADSDKIDNCQSYVSSKTISFSDADKEYIQAIRIKPFFNEATIGLWVAGGQLPAQAYKATVKTTEADQSSNAAVEVVQSVGSQTGIFDYTLWSGGGIGIKIFRNLNLALPIIN